MQKSSETTAKFRGIPDMATLEKAQKADKSILCYVMKLAWQKARCVEILQSWVPVELKIRRIRMSPTNKRAYLVRAEIAAEIMAGQVKAEFDGDSGLARWVEGTPIELEYVPEENEHYLDGTF